MECNNLNGARDKMAVSISLALNSRTVEEHTSELHFSSFQGALCNSYFYDTRYTCVASRLTG